MAIEWDKIKQKAKIKDQNSAKSTQSRDKLSASNPLITTNKTAPSFVNQKSVMSLLTQPIKTNATKGDLMANVQNRLATAPQIAKAPTTQEISAFKANQPKAMTPQNMVSYTNKIAKGDIESLGGNSNPTTLERIAGTVSGATKDFAGSAVNALDWASKVPGNPLWAIKQYNDLFVPDALGKSADTLMDSGAQDIAEAKRGATGLGKTVIDVGVGGLQLAGDIGLAAVTGGGSIAPMVARSFGSATKQAENSGGSELDQLVYGGLTAGTTALVGKLSNVGGVLSKAYGKGALDGVLQKATSGAIGKLIKNGVISDKIATGIAAGVGEGFEEMLESTLSPLYQKLSYDPNATLNAEQILYDGLVGAIVGGFAGGVGGSNTQTTPQTPVENVDINKIALNVNTLTPNITKPTQNIPQQATQPTTNNIAPNLVNLPTLEQNAVEAKQAVPETILPESSTGAATQGFDPYTNALDKYGAIPDGENPSRPSDVPTQLTDDTKVSRGVRTAIEAQATTNDGYNAIGDSLMQGKFSYIPITDNSAKATATATIESKGWETAVKDWTADARSGKVSKDAIVLGQTLYNNAMNAGKTNEGIDILVDLVKMSRSGAQATQANRVLKTLSPEYQLYALQRSVASLSEELTQKFAKKGFKEITLDETLVQQYMDAKTDAERDAAMENLKNNVASQVPSTWYDKWNAWRYLAMLGNPRTHIRNIIGNAGFVPVRAVKDVIATGIENIDNGARTLFGKEQIVRTKSILSLKDTPLIKQALSDYDQVSDQIMSLGKFDNMTGDINERRRIFKNPLIEGARKGNTNLLNKEDVWFAKPAYANALAGYYKANGVTAEQLTNKTVKAETIDSARAYAIREAQRATYRDSNAFSDYVSKLGGKRGTGEEKVANALVEGILPFKRTPANILARATEYSPIGLIKGLTSDLIKVRNGKMEAWQAIDNISAGATGSMITALGALLASMGLITGGKEDDENTADLNTLTGYQDYSITIGGKNITLDWLAPEALPFFVGVELQKSFTSKSENGITFTDVLTRLGNIAEPMLDMSMLQGVDDLFSSIKYSEGSSALGVAATAAVNYISQALPTIFGQVERVAENQRQTTYVDKTNGIPTSIQYMLGKTANKIPFVDYNQIPYQDAFGNQQSSGTILNRVFSNMLNPSYVSQIKDTAVTDELKRLNEAKYLTSVPASPAKNFSYDGKPYSLSAEEYTAFSKQAGQATEKLMQSTINNASYKSMTDEQKADVMSKLMGYASDTVKREYLDSKGATYKSSTYEKTYEAEQQGISPTEYFVYKTKLSEINDNDSVTQLESTKAVEATNLSQDKKGVLWQIQNSTANPEKNPYTGTLAQRGLEPSKNIAIMETYSKIDKAMENYVKPEGGAAADAIASSYLQQWLYGNGYNSDQVSAIMEVYKYWYNIPAKASAKSNAFVSANPMP